MSTQIDKVEDVYQKNIERIEKARSANAVLFKLAREKCTDDILFLNESLIAFVKMENIEVVKDMLTWKEINVKYIDETGKNALSYAYELKNVELIYALAKAGFATL